MPAVQDVGEPCAGEPHARFDGRGWNRSVATVTGSGRPAETPGLCAGPTAVQRHPASSLPDRDRGPPVAATKGLWPISGVLSTGGPAGGAAATGTASSWTRHGASGVDRYPQ
jgi:hypothetical protein